MPCTATPRLLGPSRQPERTLRRRLWRRMHGHNRDGGAVVLAPQQQPRGSAALEVADTEDRAEAAAAAEGRRMTRAADPVLGALAELHHHLPAQAEPELW